MIFYDCATAPSPRRARMVLAEKGLTPETRQVDLRAGAHLSAEFLALNPRGTVPVLITDEGTVLTENLGIAAYLEAAFPDVLIDEENKLVLKTELAPLARILAGHIDQFSRSGASHSLAV